MSTVAALSVLAGAAHATTGLCSSHPIADCRTARTTKLTLDNGKGNPLTRKFRWVWNKGEATVADFGNPVFGTTQYHVCVYAADELLMESTIPNNSLAWKPLRTGFRYRDKAASVDGMSTARLTSGRAGAKILIQGKGLGLALPVLPVSPSSSLTIQLVASHGTCWGARYETLKRNDPLKVVALTTPAQAPPTPGPTICASGQAAQPSGSATWAYDPRNVVALGRGFDPEHPQTLFAQCFKPSTEVRVEDGASGKLEKREVTSRNDLYRMLNWDASLSGQYSGFEAEADIRQERQYSFQSDTVVFALHLNINLGKFQLQNLELTDAARALLEGHRVDEFLTMCGSRFVNQLSKDISVTLLYSFSNLEEGERQSLRSHFHAAYSSPGVDVDAEANWESAIESLNRRHTAEVRLEARGGNDQLINLLGTLAGEKTFKLGTYLDEIKQFVIDHQLSASDVGDGMQAGEPIGGGTPDLEQIPGFPTSYNVGDMTSIMAQYGVSGCFLQGLSLRDRVVSDLYLKMEEAVMTKRRLQYLLSEVERDLYREINADAVRRAILQFDVWGETLRLAGYKCSGDRDNPLGPFVGCRYADQLGESDLAGTLTSPLSKWRLDEAVARQLVSVVFERNVVTIGGSSYDLGPLLPPTLPAEVIRALYEQDEWSFHRWCTGLVYGDNLAGPQTAAGNTVAALLADLGYTVNIIENADHTKSVQTTEADCEAATFELENQRSILHLRGYPGYDAQPLAALGSVGLQTIEFNGGTLASGPAGLFNLHKLGALPELDALRILNLGYSASDWGAILAPALADLHGLLVTVQLPVHGDASWSSQPSWERAPLSFSGLQGSEAYQPMFVTRACARTEPGRGYLADTIRAINSSGNEYDALFLPGLPAESSTSSYGCHVVNATLSPIAGWCSRSGTSEGYLCALSKQIWVDGYVTVDRLIP